MSKTKQIILSIILLAIAIIYFGLSPLDINIQSKLYNFHTHTWVLGHYEQPYRLIFYVLAKRLLIVFGLILLFSLPSLFFIKKDYIVRTYKKGIIIVVLSLILVPSIVGELKKDTNMPCPKNIMLYGGALPQTKVWEAFPKKYKNVRVRCWPAGHASGGFALLSLLFLFKKRRNQIFAFIFVQAYAWSMGIYKMLIGDHFFSHNVITMILAWLIILIIAKIVFFKEDRLDYKLHRKIHKGRKIEKSA